MSESGSTSIIGKFFVALGLKIDDAGLSRFQSQVTHMTHSVEALGVAFGLELVKQVGEFVERSVGAAAAVQDFSEVTDMSAEKVAALGRVAVENSSSMEAMQGAIMGISVAWIVESVAYGGQLMDTQMGFSFVQFLDPVSAHPVAISGSLLSQVTMLLILISLTFFTTSSALAKFFLLASVRNILRTGVDGFFFASRSSIILGSPDVAIEAAIPAKWKVLRTIWVPGSPTDCAAMTPTGSPG